MEREPKSQRKWMLLLKLVASAPAIVGAIAVVYPLLFIMFILVMYVVGPVYWLAKLIVAALELLGELAEAFLHLIIIPGRFLGDLIGVDPMLLPLLGIVVALLWVPVLNRVWGWNSKETTPHQPVDYSHRSSQ